MHLFYNQMNSICPCVRDECLFANYENVLRLNTQKSQDEEKSQNYSNDTACIKHNKTHSRLLKAPAHEENILMLKTEAVVINSS